MKYNKILLSSLLSLSLLAGMLSVFAASNGKNYKEVSATAYEGNVNSVGLDKSKVIDTHDDSTAEIKTYYNALNNLSADQRKGTNLLRHLKPILQNGTFFTSYSNTRKWLMITDRDWIQSPLENPSAAYTYPEDDDLAPKVHVLYRTDNGEETAINFNGTHTQGKPGYKLNKEHTWAKSRGFQAKFESTAPGTDLHHLILADTDINSTSHSNYPYGDALTNTINPSSKVTDTYNTYGLGYRYKDSGNHWWFEPQDQDKGDIARALLYMVARYNNLAGDSLVETDFTKDKVTTHCLLSEANLTLTNMDASNYTNAGEESLSNTVINYGDLATLLRWHKLDPVSDFEIHRNNLIDNNYQKNRNPFIDYPSWVDYIWGDSEGYAQPNSDAISQYGHTGMTITGESQIVIGEQGSLDVNITGITGSNDILWESSDTDVATINSNGVVTGVAEGTTTIKAITKDSTFCAEKEIEIIESPTVHVTDVTLNKSSTSIYVGGTGTLTATVLPVNADNKTVTWSSDDEEVATVNNGTITGVKEGTATITVTTEDGGFSATCEVSVVKQGFPINGPYVVQFKTNNSDASSVLSAEALLGDEVVSTNTLISSITATEKCYKGKQGLKFGTGSATGSFSANVYPGAQHEIKTITITSSEWVSSSSVADTGKLILTVNGNQITDDITPGTDYTHTFNTPTKVTSFSVGTTAKRAYLGSVIFAKEGDIDVTGVSLNKTALALTEGNSETLTASIIPANATNKNVTWSSDNEEVATVSNSGFVETLKPGEANITVTTEDGGFTATCTVTVLEQPSGVSHIEDLIPICAALTDKSVTPDSYTFKGTVTGVYGRSFFVQEGSYGMYVYNYENTETMGITKNQVVQVTAKLAKYNNQYEAQGVTSCEILDETPEQIVPVVVNSYSEITNELQNSLITIKGLTYKSGDYDPSSASNIVFNFGTGTITYRTNTNLPDGEKTNISSKITDAKTAVRVDLVGVHCVAYNSAFQANICSSASIVTYTNKQVVQLFVDEYMHMSDYDPTLSGDGDNLCLGENGYYKKAKIALTAMSEAQINIFRTDGDFANAKARYEAWAEAFGDTTPYSEEVTPTNALRSFEVKDYVPYVVLGISLATTFALAVLIKIRKKKEQ